MIIENKDNPLASFVGLIGMCLNTYFYISPYWSLKRVSVSGNIEEIPFLMLFFSIVSTSLRVLYGMSGAGDKIAYTNIIGMSLSVVFTIWYFRIYYKEDDEKKMYSVIVIVSYYVLILSIGMYCNFNYDFAKTVHSKVGSGSCILSIILYAAPGQNMVSIFYLV